MKPFYGIDRTTLKKSTYHEGECFIAATVSELSRQSYERALQKGTAELERTRLPVVLRWTKAVCGWTAGLIALGIARALGRVTLTEAFGNAPWLFLLFGICAAAWLVLALLNRRKAKTVTAEDEFARSFRRMEGETDRIFRELGVPENAKDVDLVQLTYRWKDGKLKINTQGTETTPYTNVSMRVYRREDVLCIADVTNRYELPIAGLRCLRRVNKPLVIQGWNKDEPTNAPFYKPYKLTIDVYDRVHTKAYGLLELHHAGEDWAVWLPPYELNYISALTGLSIIEE